MLNKKKEMEQLHIDNVWARTRPSDCTKSLIALLNEPDEDVDKVSDLIRKGAVLNHEVFETLAVSTSPDNLKRETLFLLMRGGMSIPRSGAFEHVRTYVRICLGLESVHCGYYGSGSHDSE